MLKFNWNSRYQEAHDAADYIINNGGYTLCGAGCKVKNLGKRPAVAEILTNLKDLLLYLLQIMREIQSTFGL